MTKSICIVRLSALGDVLMLVPTIRALQAHFPKAQLTWIISRPAYDLVEGMEGIEFIVINKPNSFSDYWRFKRQLKDRHFDVVLALQASFRANLLYPLISAKRKIGYDKARAKDGHRWFIHESIHPGEDHTLEGFFKFAFALGVEKTTLQWNLPITASDYEWAKANIPTHKPLLIVNPAASKPERSWLADRYVEVIEQAKKRWQVEVVLTGGPGQHDRALADHIMHHTACIDLVGKTKPKQLLAVISMARAVVCPDTGPSHMATAVNTPVVALHAVTNPAISGPYTFRHLAVNCYPEAVASILQKKPETIRWGTRAHGLKTMELIKAPAILAKLESIFNQDL